jgi:uncharacterized protein
MIRAERSLLALSRRDCLALLARTQVGRVVFTERALPAVVPVAFAMDEDAIVMCTASGTRLAAAAAGGVLAFQVDDIDATTRTGWSVVVIGVADLVDGPMDQARIRCLVEPWAPGSNDVYIRLPLTTVSGRAIHATDDVDV